jgi:hypothetical protein
VYFGVRDNIKYLFKSLTSHKNIIINLNGCGYDNCDLFYFNPSENNIKAAQRQLNCMIKIFSDKDSVITAIQIRFNNPRLHNPLTVIEVLEIFQLLYIYLMSQERTITLFCRLFVANL